MSFWAIHFAPDQFHFAIIKKIAACNVQNGIKFMFYCKAQITSQYYLVLS